MMNTHVSGKEETEVRFKEIQQEKQVLVTEITSLKLVNTELQTKLDSLQVDLEAQRSTQGQQRSSSDTAAHERIRQLEADNDNVKEQLTHTMEENEQFLESIKELQTQLKEQDKQSDTIRNLNEDNDVLVMEIKDLQKEIENLNSSKSAASPDIDDLREKLSTLKKQNKELEEENRVLIRQQVTRHIETADDKKDKSRDKNDETSHNSDVEKAVESLMIKSERVVTLETIQKRRKESENEDDEGAKGDAAKYEVEISELKEKNASLIAQVGRLT